MANERQKEKHIDRVGVILCSTEPKWNWLRLSCFSPFASHWSLCALYYSAGSAWCYSMMKQTKLMQQFADFLTFIETSTSRCLLYGWLFFHLDMALENLCRWSPGRYPLANRIAFLCEWRSLPMPYSPYMIYNSIRYLQYAIFNNILPQTFVTLIDLTSRS